ncbi:hypothetical protein [Hartmannibacter diazotrophicus]|uniref:hypothetical protein n=1 Tax=Hartmannibacter diazotrophicus TaxID=1482074 RepID=UPI0012FDE404|nr:hypothetical protein [Hartmannibacter diazotrophicus]
MTIRNGSRIDIGAVGFSGNKAVAIASFFDPRDGNYDGKVNLLECMAGHIPNLALEQRAIMQIAEFASINSEVISRDADFAMNANHLFVKYGMELTVNAIYSWYIDRNIKSIGATFTRNGKKSMIKCIAVRKGLEHIVKNGILHP